jgi:hypothetical protein
MSSASPALPRWLATVSGALTLLGLVGLILTLAIGFETPNTVLLLVSGPLTFAAPLAALWHLFATHTLTAAEKRVWAKELTGADAFSAMSEYMTSSDLSASAQRRSAHAAARREARNHT